MKKITSILLSSTILFAIFISTVSAITFSDVPDSEMFKDAIFYLADSEIVKGNPDGTFKPLKPLNRAEMLKIIAEAQAKVFAWPEGSFDGYGTQNCFSDVKPNQWYTKYVCYGKEKGWVIGYEGGKYFKPEQKVTFVEALKITYKGFSMEYDESTNPWYKDLVMEASEKNFIPYNVIGFNVEFMRNQMADMITRILKNDESEGALEEYLDDRADIVVTYETIENKQDLSKLEKKVITPKDDEETGMTGEKIWTVKMQASKFEPSSLIIKQGDDVLFINDSDTDQWPASNIHPIHSDYPGSGIEKCNTADAGKIFDACKVLKKGESFTFTFNEKGTWKYHNHVNPSFTGTIVVE